MKAVVWTNYGPPDVLQLRDVPTPQPKPNEVLIKIHATTVTAGDCEARSLSFPWYLAGPMRLFIGIRKPTRRTILGQELSGVVEAIGSDVTKFKVGDAVFGTTGFHFGGYAEYTCLPEQFDDGVLVTKPDNLSFEEAAAVSTGGLEAVHFLRAGKLQKGEKLLINGAGGSIGTAGIQLAKHYYGAEVTAVDHTSKLDMLREIGADLVIDYTQEDFSQRPEKYDVVFDVIGKSSFSRSIKALKPNGRYLMANPMLHTMFRGMAVSLTSGKKVIANMAARNPDDLSFLKGLIEEGKFRVLIDRTYPLAQTAEAHQYVETGQKKGNLIIKVV